VSYRADLDGLRALAVLAVIGYHAAPRFVPGGFVGVDVFFVISGFLISGILFEQFSTGTLNLADFYARRVRRIVPALLIVLLAVWALGWFVLIGEEYLQLEKHIAAGSAFVSNFVLRQEAGYFDGPSELKPLLHLWSLGIEEQFYLFWPPVVYLCLTRRWNLMAVAAAVIAASFATNIALVSHHAAAAFYLPVSRMWELLAGAVLAYFERFRQKAANLESPSSAVTPARARLSANLKAVIGLACIALALVALNRNAEHAAWWSGSAVLHRLASLTGLDRGAIFPAWWALLPVIGATALISAGPQAWINRSILSRRPLVQLGLISYPLYLWHWPLLSTIRITESGHPSLRLTSIVLALSFLLAWATYQLVERPIRAHINIRTPGRVLAVACSLVVVAGASLSAYVTERPGPRTPLFASNIAPRLRSPHPGPDCRLKFPTRGSYCTEYAPNLKLTTALVGDSHAEHFLTGIGSNLAARGEDVVLLGEPGCPPLFDVESIELGIQRNCAMANKSVLDLVGADPNISRVILAFRGVADIDAPYTLAGTSLDAEESIKRGLDRTVGYLAAKHKQVWLILQVPEVEFSIRDCLARPFSFESAPPPPCGDSESDVLAAQRRFRQMVGDLKQNRPFVQVFDPVPFLCEHGWCPAVKGGHVLYADRHHLTPAGSLFFADKFSFN
jgi:peptidoglycan/LPS O-acetylase OafA/YrhL